MRNMLFMCLIIALFTPTTTQAQCNPYFDYQKGTSLTQTNYNAKGKEEGSQQMTIVDVTKNNNQEIMATDMVIYDKKGKEVAANQIDLICEDGVFKMDMSRFVPPGMDEMEGISISFEGDQLEMPGDLSTGKTLQDARFTVNVQSDNPALSSMMGGTDITISNRKVEARESITTAAGTFDCFRISYNTKVETKMMGMTRAFETKGVEWITEGAGMVRTESYDKKGSLSGYTELTAFNK